MWWYISIFWQRKLPTKKSILVVTRLRRGTLNLITDVFLLLRRRQSLKVRNVYRLTAYLQGNRPRVLSSSVTIGNLCLKKWFKSKLKVALKFSPIAFLLFCTPGDTGSHTRRHRFTHQETPVHWSRLYEELILAL